MMFVEVGLYMKEIHTYIHTAGKKNVEEGKLLPMKFCDFEGENKEMHKGNLLF